MPPKKLRNDWSWVDQVKSIRDITDQHRLAAAGLTDVVPCTYAFPIFNGDETPVKEKRCNKRYCETNPACYNYLGVTDLLDPRGKGKYVESKLSKRTEKRKEGIPAGLRNLGATCYANAFLQLWFHNIPFRNAIYACAPIPGSPLFHLAHIFASLQYTEKRFIDPMALIESLRLNKGEQQDAAEFSKLFLEMITNELLKQKDLKLRGLTKDLFEGTIQYTTKCDCGFASQRDSSFLELELSLKEGTSLMDRLECSLTDERLEGDNQYHCQSCGVKRDATRSAAITSLPPILHFSLLRFVFDPKTYDRRKSRASITFPRHLELGGHDYHLQAIITHSGPSAHEGHFVCEAQEQATGMWFMCDDEDVSQIKRSRMVHEDEARQASGVGSGSGSEPPLKRAKTEENTLRSKDAYMLVYTRLGAVDPTPPPADIMHKIDLELAEWDNDQGRQEVEEYILEDEYHGLIGAKKQVARILPGMDCLIPSAELARWFGAEKLDDLFKPWNIPVCPHGDVDPDSTGLFKMVSLEAFELLQRYGFDIPHGYSKTPKRNRKHEIIDLSQSPPPVAEELPSIGSVFEPNSGAHATPLIPTSKNSLAVDTDGTVCADVSGGMNMDIESDRTDGGGERMDIVDDTSKTNGVDGTNGTSKGKVTKEAEAIDMPEAAMNAPTRSVSRENGFQSHASQTPSRHGSSNAIASSSKLNNGAELSRTPSSQSGTQSYSILPRMTICPTCVEAEYQSRTIPGLSKEDKEFWKAETKIDRQIMKSLDPKFVIYDIDYYYLPDEFVEPWEEFVKYDYAPRPKLSSDLGRCGHGLLPVDLEMDEIHFIDQKGWDQVVLKYGDAEAVTFRLPKVKPDNGRRSAKARISVGTCEPCRRERLLDFEATQIYLKLERTSIPTSRRSKNKEVSHDVRKTTTVLDIKVEIMHQTNITPINLILYHNGRELGNEETVGSIGILSGDQVVGKEMEVIGVTDEPVAVERGFGGTALHGRLACPDCTFENQPAVVCCEMCQRPFGFDS